MEISQNTQFVLSFKVGYYEVEYEKNVYYMQSTELLDRVREAIGLCLEVRKSQHEKIIFLPKFVGIQQVELRVRGNWAFRSVIMRTNVLLENIWKGE